MSNLYKELAEVYEAMYQTFINYKEEYLFYSKILERFHKKSVLEIGSGTGNLAEYFLSNGFDYMGLDKSTEMIAIAKAKVQNCQFIEGDMSNFELSRPVQSMIITGRTISYLIENKEVSNAFSSMNENLVEKGILCFDFIDANKFIPHIVKEPRLDHQAEYKGEKYLREATWVFRNKCGMDIFWDATYFKEVAGVMQELGKDSAIARAFTLNEMEIFLEVNKFRILEVTDRATYAFPTKVIVAERVG